MERLVTTSEAAQILGLSLQGVHYRIKKNQLKSIKKSGKLYVYLDENSSEESIHKDIKPNKVYNKALNDKYYEDIVKVKDEQIGFLKDSIKWMKKQYKQEIFRLEKNQKKIVKVFNSEIKLLQSAFNEMRSIYKNQNLKIENNYSEKQKDEKDFISLKEFFILFKQNGKTNHEIKLIILEAIKNNDKRFIYNKNEKKLLILNSDFNDLK